MNAGGGLGRKHLTGSMGLLAIECHNCLCVNSSHISLEPHPINNNRQYCKSSNQCYGHGEYSDCLLQLKLH